MQLSNPIKNCMPCPAWVTLALASRRRKREELSSESQETDDDVSSSTPVLRRKPQSSTGTCEQTSDCLSDSEYEQFMRNFNLGKKRRKRQSVLSRTSHRTCSSSSKCLGNRTKRSFNSSNNKKPTINASAQNCVAFPACRHRVKRHFFNNDCNVCTPTIDLKNKQKAKRTKRNGARLEVNSTVFFADRDVLSARTSRFAAAAQQNPRRGLYEDHKLVMSNLRSSFIKTIELANWWLRFVERTRNIQLPAIEWDKNSSFLEQLQVLCLMTGQLRAHEIYQPAFDAENDILIILLQLKTVCNALLDSRKKDARDVLQTPSPPPLHDTTAFPSLSEPSNAYSLASLAQPSAPPQPSQSSVNAQPMDSQRASSSTSDAVAPKLSLSSFAACGQSSSGLASNLSCAPTPVSVPAFKSGVGSQPMKKQISPSKRSTKKGLYKEVGKDFYCMVGFPRYCGEILGSFPLLSAHLLEVHDICKPVKME
uniref:C2H2-type domain-containing protein n=1 Tax=Ditylenchus dipsaci TaxID=166011 RepID=A0A915EKE7_9BILA